MKEVVFTDYALMRMRMRDITRAEVREALEAPRSRHFFNTKHVRMNVRHRLSVGGRTIVVSYEERDDEIVVRVEIVGAREVIGTSAGKLDFIGELVGVKEAAQLSGKDKANFLRDLASREDFPRPVVELASGRYWLSGEIKRYLRQHKIAG